MAKNVLITPAGGKIEFSDTSVLQAQIYELDGILYITAPIVVLGDGTSGIMQLGDVANPITLELLGGGVLTSSTNTLDIGAAGDTINLNIPGVTYNLPSNVLTNSEFNATNLLTMVKTVDGSGSGLDSDLLDGQDSTYYLSWSNFTNKPTTLSGYGITDAAPSSHVGATGAAHGIATTSVNGFMSSTDKTKLDGIADNANNYTHPASHAPSIITQDASNRFVTDAEKTTWNAKASTAVATTSVAGLMSAADKTKLDGVATGAQANQNAFSNVAVSGQTTVAADSATDTLTLVAGTAVTITTDAGTDTVTISSSDTVYTHPTTDGNLHVPATGTTNNGKALIAGATAGSFAWTTLTAAMVGLGNVTNESKATMFTSPTFTGTVSGITATMVGLGNVNNTSDANKPISTATQTALDGKVSTAYLSSKAVNDANIANTHGININYLQTAATNAPTGTDHALLTMNFSSIWSVQLAGDWRTNDLFIRNQNNGIWGSWQKIWHAGNDGTTSGLDADLLDGQHGSYYAPINSPTFTGTVSGITATMVGLGNVTNESKATMFTSPTFTGTVSGITATMVGLGNVTNESKATMFTSPTFTGTPLSTTAAVGTNTTQIATTAFVNAEIANDAAPIAHVGATGTAHGIATTSVNGFMSSTDKTKLDGIATGAQANQNAFSNVAVSGQTTVAADSATDTLTLVAGTAVTITTDSANDTITISSSDTVYTHPTTDGNMHVPVTSTTNNGKALIAGATAGSFAWTTLTATMVGLGNVTNESKATMFTSPTFTGTPISTTAAVGTNTTQIATTAFVNAEIANDAAPIAHVGATGTAHGVATTSVNGFMSSTDKTKLDGIDTGAQANQNAFTNIAVSGQTTVAADSATDTLTLVAGTNVTITTDAATDSITITASGGQPATVAPLASGTAAVGVSTKYAREDHVHPKEYVSGSSTFNTTTGVTITHNLGHTNYKVAITPTSSSSGYLGEYYVTKNANSIVVYCTGSTTTTTFDYIITTT